MKGDQRPIVACLSWFDEPVESLDACVRSLAGVADRLLAVDGRYLHYPVAETVSPREQRVAIRAAAEEANLDVRICGSYSPWRSAVAKRAWMMERAVPLAAGGWCLVIDADETIASTSARFHHALAHTAEDVCLVDFMWLEHGTRAKTRRLFRALPGLTVESLHYRYMVGKRVLWGQPGQEPTGDLSRHLLMHHAPARPATRQAARERYYSERNRLNLETLG